MKIVSYVLRSTGAVSGWGMTPIGGTTSGNHDGQCRIRHVNARSTRTIISLALNPERQRERPPSKTSPDKHVTNTYHISRPFHEYSRMARPFPRTRGPKANPAEGGCVASFLREHRTPRAATSHRRLVWCSTTPTHPHTPCPRWWSRRRSQSVDCRVAHLFASRPSRAQRTAAHTGTGSGWPPSTLSRTSS